MPNPRKKEYVDIYLNAVDLKQLRKGYTAHAVVRGVRYAIHATKADKVVQKIARLLDEVNKLKRQYSLVGKGRRPYIKKNKEFWDKGGNVKHLLKKRKETT